MTKFKDKATEKNLKLAFEIEADGVQRYLYFALLADIEGFPEIAQLFRELAESASCNAHGNLDFLRQTGDPTTGLPIGETECNLAAALTAEQRDFSESYPKMAMVAHQEGHPDIASWFETLMKNKQSHTAKLDKALQQMNSSAVKVE